jgi:glycosyltransferase involved in cell wall biosynthesis
MEPNREAPDRPSLAVLLPVRDGAEVLDAAMVSLEAQTFRDFQLIVIDDGSADETPRLLRAAHARWSGRPSLTVLRLESPSGIAEALRAGAEAARGVRLLARQDADDQSHPHRLARQVEFLAAHPEIGVVATGVRLVSAGVVGNGWRRYERWLRSCSTPEEIARNLWIESPLPHPTVMMRAEAYERAGGYQPGPWPEDYDLWLRMHGVGVRLARLPEELYDWTDHPRRASRTLPQYAPESFVACKARHLSRHLDGRPAIVWGAGRDGRRVARALLREGARIEAFLDIDPRKIGRRAYGRPILAAEEWLARPESRRSPGEERPIVLAAVGAEGARDLIRARLLAAGFAEGTDFLCLA